MSPRKEGHLPIGRDIELPACLFPRRELTEFGRRQRVRGRGHAWVGSRQLLLEDPGVGENGITSSQHRARRRSLQNAGPVIRRVVGYRHHRRPPSAQHPPPQTGPGPGPIGQDPGVGLCSRARRLLPGHEKGCSGSSIASAQSSLRQASGSRSSAPGKSHLGYWRRGVRKSTSWPRDSRRLPGRWWYGRCRLDRGGPSRRRSGASRVSTVAGRSSHETRSRDVRARYPEPNP